MCGAPATTTDGAMTTSTAGCPDGRNVVLMTVDGGGHEWPSFATQSAVASSSPPTAPKVPEYYSLLCDCRENVI